MKKLFSVVVLSLLILASSFSITQAGWRSTNDTLIGKTYLLRNGLRYSNTGARVKETNTSVYVNLTRCTGDLRVKVLAYNGLDFTEGTGAYISAPGEYLIHNQIYEHGYTYCKLEFSLCDNCDKCEFEGLWSPDSVGRYPAANTYR